MRDVINVDAITVDSNSSSDLCDVIQLVPVQWHDEPSVVNLDPIEIKDEITDTELYEPQFIQEDPQFFREDYNYNYNGDIYSTLSMHERRDLLRREAGVVPSRHRRIRRRLEGGNEITVSDTGDGCNFIIRKENALREAPRRSNPTHSRAAVALSSLSSDASSHLTDSYESIESIEPIWKAPSKEAEAETHVNTLDDEFCPARTGTRKWLVLGDENPAPMELNSIFAVRLTVFNQVEVSTLIEEWLVDTPPPPTNSKKVRSLYMIDWLHSQLEPHESCIPTLDDESNSDVASTTPFVSLNQLWEEISREKFNWFPKKSNLDDWLRRRESVLFPSGVTRISKVQPEDLSHYSYSLSPNEGTKVLHSCFGGIRSGNASQYLINVRWRYGRTMPAAVVQQTATPFLSSAWLPYRSSDWICDPCHLSDVTIRSGVDVMKEYGAGYLTQLLGSLDSEIYGGGDNLLTSTELKECLQMNIRFQYFNGAPVGVLVVEFRSGIGWCPPPPRPRLGTTEILPKRDPELAYIHYLGVIDSCRGNGLAKYFVSSLTNLSILLEVHNSNEGAISLYSKFGLSQIGPSRGADEEWSYMFRYRGQRDSDVSTNTIENLLASYPGAVS
eukprot:TRINITY_DN20800_c0_g1_i2.p1 TRINITY_DN20800_c0_g1~~TRINITY_DN20800_c0_g1_i2.p1  ORF type:complete len:613 (+),score=96.97 TRINITY_DN20800_c0_g1_i2:111-1949(+)